MWHAESMEVQRTITILLPDDADLRATLAAFCAVQNAVSESAFNGGKPLRAVALQRVVYQQVKGTLSSRMTLTALPAGGWRLRLGQAQLRTTGARRGPAQGAL
jgi:hypothetical protein